MKYSINGVEITRCPSGKILWGTHSSHSAHRAAEWIPKGSKV
jgi:hypothetical protein